MQNRLLKPTHHSTLAAATKAGVKRSEILAAKSSGGKKIAQAWLYADIGTDNWSNDPVTAKQFAADLSAVGDVDEIHCFVNSQGGDVFEGLAIYNILKAAKAKKIVRVDGLAASIASVICMAGDEITMSANAFMMIHDPWTLAMGNAANLREIADQLDKVGGQLADTYARRSGMDRDKVGDLMGAETWMTADEAVEYGFADGKTESESIAASLKVNRGRFKAAPRAILPADAAPASLRDQLADAKRYLQNRRNPAPVAARPKADTLPGSPDLPPQTSPKPGAKPGANPAQTDPETTAAEACHTAAKACMDCMNAATGSDEEGHGELVRACMNAQSACHAASGMLGRSAGMSAAQAKVCKDACQAVSDMLDDSPDEDAAGWKDDMEACVKACGVLEK